MDSAGTSHDEALGDLCELVHDVVLRLSGADWGRAEEIAEDDDQEDEEDSLLEVRDAAVATLTRLEDRLQEAMFT